MANLTANSGTTFISDGGSVGVQVNTNTNWRFYLTGSTGVPDWLHFNGNVTEITGSESQLVNVEATKNNNSTARSASGICVSTSETGLTAWTLFYQGAGGGSGSDTVELNFILRVKAATSNVKLTSFFLDIPANPPTRMFTWNASTSSMSEGIPISPNGTVIEFNHFPVSYTASTVTNAGSNRYEVSAYPYGSSGYAKANTGSQRIGVNMNGYGTSADYTITGSGVVTIDSYDLFGGYFTIS